MPVLPAHQRDILRNIHAALQRQQACAVRQMLSKQPATATLAAVLPRRPPPRSPSPRHHVCSPAASPAPPPPDTAIRSRSLVHASTSCPPIAFPEADSRRWRRRRQIRRRAGTAAAWHAASHALIRGAPQEILISAADAPAESRQPPVRAERERSLRRLAQRSARKRHEMARSTYAPPFYVPAGA